MGNSKLEFQTASELRKKGEYERAIVIYSELWNNQKQDFDKWSGWGYAFSLLKVKHYQESLEICRKLYPLYKDFEMLKSVYSANIYYSEFKFNSKPEVNRLRKAVNAIVELTPPYSAYSFAPKAIFKFVKVLLAQMQINWNEIENQLLKLNPEWLDDAAFKFTDSRGKITEQASDLEQWFAGIIKAQAGLNKPEELLHYLAEARNRNIKWHYSNDLWFKRKEAYAYLQLGDREKAERILREILLVKKDWFIRFDLALTVEDEKKKFNLLCRAALEKGKPEMKLKLFEAISTYLKDNSREEALVNDHLLLPLIIRKEKGWTVNLELLNNLINQSIYQSKLPQSSDLLKKLKPFWEENSGRKQKQIWKGQISRILPNGAAGFIKAKEGYYYFNQIKGKKEFVEGEKVGFELVDSFDKKKNKPSKMAVNIHSIKN